ncbi:hypothetical protein [Roseomonas xinghualingensis]|uniref:hypothetical protein n=1 Tax=Roseomonas xinghualingensis TaxID=2986475 RepID=UPI0021F2325B|nr:hypothetical protein [Roseomonas sp. SXEYE001]MCV4206892.1 hypothetical protein [Roseomonas sp. SXEYE001]
MHTDEELRGLKTAFGNLVSFVGGGTAAETVTRVGKSQLSDYSNHNRMDSFPPIDVVADLIAVAAQPFVLRELALLAGYQLTAFEPVDSTQLAAAIAEGTREAADVPAAYLDALADGRLSRTEAHEVQRQAIEAADKMMSIAGIAGQIARTTASTNSPTAPAVEGEGTSASGPKPSKDRGGRKPRKRT